MPTQNTKAAFKRGMNDYAKGIPMHEPPFWTPEMRGSWVNGWLYAEAKTKKKARN
jgi:ribosome modulation factor